MNVSFFLCTITIIQFRPAGHKKTREHTSTSGQRPWLGRWRCRTLSFPRTQPSHPSAGLFIQSPKFWKMQKAIDNNIEGSKWEPTQASRLFMVAHTKQIILSCDALLVFNHSGCGGSAREKCSLLKPKKIYGLFGLVLRKCVLRSDGPRCDRVYWNEMEAPTNRDSCEFLFFVMAYWSVRRSSEHTVSTAGFPLISLHPSAVVIPASLAQGHFISYLSHTQNYLYQIHAKRLLSH